VVEIKKIYGEESNIYFIAGTDTIMELHTWKDIDALLSLCKFIAVYRPGYPMNIPQKYVHGIYRLEIEGINISSSDIRRRVARHESIKGLVPDKVEEYIYKHRLYIT
jgi:nicotinate-nucleotide adenylyltransferase